MKLFLVKTNTGKSYIISAPSLIAAKDIAVLKRISRATSSLIVSDVTDKYTASHKIDLVNLKPGVILEEDTNVPHD